MSLGFNHIAPKPLLTASVIVLPLWLLFGCASLGPSKNWQADSFDQQTKIMFAQIGLRSEGFDTGPVDGVEGPRTVAATAAYQRSTGMPATARIDAKLIETIFHDHNLSKPMPYVEGSIRSCFRWAPNRVVIMASTLGTLTCTVVFGHDVKPNEIDLAAKFCTRALPIQSDEFRCELIWDGRRIVNPRRLMQLLNDPSPDLPILVRSQELVENIDSKTNAILQTEPPLYQFHQSALNLKPPTVLRTPLQARIIGMRGRTICEGTVTPIDHYLAHYNMTCFGDMPIQGDARLVGVVPVGDLLLPAYETTAQYRTLKMSIMPPKNTIRFDMKTP